MESRTKVAWASGFVVLAIMAAWLLGWFGGDPAIASLQALGEQMADDNLPSTERDALRDQFRQQMESLSDDQRRSYFDANRERWQARQQQQLNDFFNLPKNEQQKKLDDMIGRMNQPRGNQPSRGGGQAAGGPTGGNRGGRTEAQREERAKRRLDGATPKMRAQFAEFRRRLNERAQQLGKPLNGRPRSA